MRRIILLLTLVFTVLNTQGQETFKEYGSWYTVSVKKDISDKFYAAATVQMRRVDFLKHTKTILVISCFNYRVSDQVSVGIGHVYGNFHPYGATHPSIEKNEDRFWQHLTVKSPLSKGTIIQRLAFEARFKDVIDKSVTPNVIDGRTYAQRFRYRLHYLFPLSEKFTTKLSNEIRVGFKNGLSRPAFDQNNFGVFVGTNIAKQTKAWLGYGRDYYKLGPDKFKSKDIFHVQMNITL